MIVAHALAIKAVMNDRSFTRIKNLKRSKFAERVSFNHNNGDRLDLHPNTRSHACRGATGYKSSGRNPVFLAI